MQRDTPKIRYNLIFRKNFVRRFSNFDKLFTDPQLFCIIDKLKEYFPDPSVFKDGVDLDSPSLNIYDRCDLKW